jgi:hypothetical protein
VICKEKPILNGGDSDENSTVKDIQETMWDAVGFLRKCDQRIMTLVALIAPCHSHWLCKRWWAWCGLLVVWVVLLLLFFLYRGIRIGVS